MPAYLNGNRIGFACILFTVLLSVLCNPVAQAENRGKAGYIKSSFSYTAAAEENRQRTLFIWYPTSSEEQRFDYRPQIGSAAPDGKVAKGPHPLVIFSHGYLGTGDQTIFLTEELARHGYIVAAVNHADSLAEGFAKQRERPNFGDPKSWDDKKFVDRKEDGVALIDYMLAENARESSPFQAKIDVKRIGMMGHSLGGYTTLGMVGGWPKWKDERIGAALVLSPYSTPFLESGSLRTAKVPIMAQGGTLDFGITPFLPKLVDLLPEPRYYLVFKAENHFGWTNLASVGKTTREAIEQGNPKLITHYSIAFLNRHLRNSGEDQLLDGEGKDLHLFRKGMPK